MKKNYLLAAILCLITTAASLLIASAENSTKTA